VIKFNCPNCHCQSETFIEYDFVQAGINKSNDIKYQEVYEKYRKLQCLVSSVNTAMRMLKGDQKTKDKIGRNIIGYDYSDYIKVTNNAGNFDIYVEADDLFPKPEKFIQCQLCGKKEYFSKAD
jgi:hypothetical protein